ncbi:MAG: hypothetical protein U0989_18820 [Azonexus sp.]|nr:hypothetical protein [Azonexus sp.]MDZ4316809.1 hypothetical protein [Azonexus sp.]
MEMRYTSQQLEKIVDEATIYMCACPAQVAVQLRYLRELYRYQTRCQLDPGNDQAVHQTIAAATLEAHALMENCMEKVLTMEGWDPITLKMPEGLRRKRDDFLDRDE